MNDRSMQFRVGVMALLTLAIAAVLVVLFAQPQNLLQDHITVYVEAPQAPGVTRNTPVRKNGILVGRVRDVQLTDTGARVTLSIMSRFRTKLRRNEMCQIGGGSLLGDSELSFVRDTKLAAADVPIETGDVLRGSVRPDPLGVLSKFDGPLSEAVNAITSASQQVATMANRIGAFVDGNQQPVQHVVSRSTQTMARIESTAAKLEQLVGDPELNQALKTSLAEVPLLMREARAAAQQLRHTMDSAGESFTNLRQFTGPLADNGQGLYDRYEKLIDTLQESAEGAQSFTRRAESFIEDLSLFSQALNNRRSTVGKLINDSELYDNLVQATDNVNRVLVELRPVLYNARLFTDRIARHPESLGVRGAIDTSSGSRPVRPVYPR